MAKAGILIVDDEPANLSLLMHLLGPLKAFISSEMMEKGLVLPGNAKPT